MATQIFWRWKCTCLLAYTITERESQSTKLVAFDSPWHMDVPILWSQVQMPMSSSCLTLATVVEMNYDFINKEASKARGSHGGRLFLISHAVSGTFHMFYLCAEQSNLRIRTTSFCLFIMCVSLWKSKFAFSIEMLILGCWRHWSMGHFCVILQRNSCRLVSASFDFRVGWPSSKDSVHYLSYCCLLCGVL